jgi:hypothetical protein
VPVAEEVDDSHLTMMERRPWTRRVDRLLPERFRDVLPQPPPSLPPANIARSFTSDTQPPPPSADQRSATTPSLAVRIRTCFRRIFTTRNIFGFSRVYHTSEMPSYDPEAHVSMRDLSNIHVDVPSHSDSQTFHPYPNQSAFRLGDWFWNGGVQKSQASFNELMEIIGDPGFQLEDVRDIKWDQINKDLAEEAGEWVDEDAGWTRTPFSISVPYQPRRGIPSVPHAGPRDFVVGDFYHRSLVSVIREKLSGLSVDHLFHFEPYELLWQPANDKDYIRVQSELYNSPAFIDAHRELQESPSEPGCDLPRVIVALMFWSDATQLTAFSNTKLWPLYLFFGNESKYRRCKPSCHLCEHVAYFQMVRLYLMRTVGPNGSLNSFQPPSKILLPRRPVEVKLQGRHS